MPKKGARLCDVPYWTGTHSTYRTIVLYCTLTYGVLVLYSTVVLYYCTILFRTALGRYAQARHGSRATPMGVLPMREFARCSINFQECRGQWGLLT